jgi:hypothetical protein
MSKQREESSVKLDLGATEQEEEESEEEEDEESEILEEEGEDDGIVDFNLDLEEEKPEMEQVKEVEEKVIEPENKSDVIMGESFVRENTENEGIVSDNEENNLKTKSSHHDRMEQKTTGTQRKKKPVVGNSNGGQKKNIMNADLSHISPNKKRAENTEKTVFTRISEDLFSKFVSNKDSHNKKTSAYEYLINDMFLNRVVEKNDKESAAKFNDFVNRNKEFRNKKQLKLQEKSEKIANELNATYTGRPNGKVFDKSELRDPNEYLQDQIKYYQTRDMNIKQQQDDIKKNTDSHLKQTPDISKKSKQLAEKRLSTENNSKEVYDRLFQDKLHKEKKHLYTEKSERSTLSKISNIPLKKTHEEIKELVEKLFRDAETRRENKEKTAKNKIKIKEVYHLYDSDDELSSCKTNIKILEKLVQNFQDTLYKLFERRDSFMMSFGDFCSILLNLGFIVYDHETGISNPQEELNKTETEKKIKEKELKLVKDAWKILITGTNKIHIEGEIPEENSERIDTYQLIVFLASILGLHKGEENELNYNTNVNNSHILNTFVPTEGNANDKFDSIPLSDMVADTFPYETPQAKNLSTLNNSTASPRKEEKKKVKVTNRFSTPGQKNTFSNMNASLSVHSTHKKSKIIDNKGKKEKKNLLRMVLPELDIKKYHYLRTTVKQIKSLFRVMYDNRVFFLVEAKKKTNLEKLNLMEKEESMMRQVSFQASEGLRQSAENFRKRIYQEIENEILKKPEASSQSAVHHEGKAGRHLRLDEVYNILRKKKEK